MANKKTVTKKKATTKKTTKKKTSRKKTVTKKVRKKTAKKTGRPKGSKNQPKPVEAAPPAEEQVSKKTGFPPLSYERATQWILSQPMHFGLVNQGFSIGNIFTVDWENQKMRCENNGMVYDNIKDLEIAIKLGVAEPYGEDESSETYEEQKEFQRLAHERKLDEQRQSRKQRDEDVRHMIDQSDRDVINDIDISDTRKTKRVASDPTRITVSSEVSVLKPQAKTSMPVHYSDGPQDGKLIRSSNQSLVRDRVLNTSTNAKPLSPVLSKTNYWDATKSGSVESDIRKKLSDYSIKVDENGQQYIRGLPVIRDDSEASGPSRNEGTIISMTKEQLAERSHKIQIISSEKHQEVAINRQKSGQVIQDVQYSNPAIVPRGPEMDVSGLTPQELVPGMGVSDAGVEPIEATIIPIGKTAKKKKSSIAGKLLRRRG